ncbi:MAG TPA: hypothetical protein VEJ41_01850 [Candidatus Acidoferrales bacterium]|nr:hypothetical protein [Candidatus Acidoferrales bacterium]
MDEPASPEGWVQFVPPIARKVAPEVGFARNDSPAPPHDEAALDETAETVLTTSESADAGDLSGLEAGDAAPELASTSTDSLVDQETPDVTCETVLREQVPSASCDHEAQVRSEAVRLAAIACGRALRHVAAIHPQLLAAFVDEAIAAIAPVDPSSVVARLDARDEGSGSVAIEVDDTGIEADIETRAALLVRAAASA